MNTNLLGLCMPFHRPARTLGLLVLASSVWPVIAADKTWDGEGANDNWQTTANWDPSGGGGIAPVANDWLFFDGATRLTPNNNFTVGTIFGNLTFNGGASSFTLGGNAFTLPAPPAAAYAGGLNAPYIGGSITNASPSAQTINSPLTLANGHHQIVGDAGGSTISLASPLTLGSAASVSFSGGVNVTGSGLANVNGILGGWATTLAPTSWAALDGGGNVVEYAAFTDISAGGTISSAAASNVRILDSGANVTLAAGGTTDINTLHFGTGPTGNQTVEVAAGRILRFGAKGGIFNASRQITGTSRVLTIGTNTTVGAVTAGGADNTPGDLYLIETPFIGNTGNQLVMNSRITNNGTAAVTVHMFGHISFPNVAHSYSGGTYIHGGRLSATGPNTLGTGPVFVYPGGQLFLNAAGTYTNPVSIAGLGNAESAGNGAIRMGGRTISGTVTLMADAATANGTLSGIITGPGGLIVGAGQANGVLTLTIGSASGPNDYAGDTLINGTNATAASPLQIAAARNNVMPHGSGKGNVTIRGISATVEGTFILNGTAQTINGLYSAGTEAATVVTNGAAGGATLTVGDGNANGDFGGSIRSSVALTKIGAGTQILRGINTYTNGTTVNGGTLSFTALGSFPTAGTGAVTVNSNATLNVSAVTPLAFGGAMTMSNGTVAMALSSSTNAITTPTLNAQGNTNYVAITSIPAIVGYPAQLVAIKYTTLNGTLNFGLSGSLPVSPGTPYAGYISNNTANGSVDLVLTGGPLAIKWRGYSSGAPNSAWDTTTANWVLFTGPTTTYSEGSFVTFDDSASNSLVTLSQNLSPAGITVNNSALSYTINGGNNISGNGGLTKQGSGTLILNNALNDFSGGVAINGGTLQVGNNDSSGNLPFPGSVVDNAALVFARSDSVTVANNIFGTGSVSQNGAGLVNLSGVNTYSGNTTVNQGTLQIGSGSALGTTNGGTTVATGATLDFNAMNIGLESVTVSGSGVGAAGALVNNGAQVFPAVAFVTLTGNTVIGGSGRWDLRSSVTGNPNLSKLLTGGQPYKLTKVAGNQISIVGTTVDPALGDVDVQGGILSIEVATTGLGNPASNLTVQAGATLQFFNMTNRLNKVITLNGDGAAITVNNDSGDNTVIGPMTLNGDCRFDIDGGTSLTLNNTIGGPGSLTKTETGSLILAGTASHAGGTLVNFGSLYLTGTHAGGLTNGAITTLVGSGTNVGTVDVSGILVPGNSNAMGTFTVGTLNFQGTSTLFHDLGFNATVGSGSNDLIQVNGDLVINGGTINIVPQGILQTGVPYRLFNYSNNLIWNADPSIPNQVGYSFAIDTNTPGQVKVIASGGPPVWNGGSATVNNWTDPANWTGTTIGPGDFLYFGGVNRLNNINDTPAGTTYSDLVFIAGAGAFTLNGNPIDLGGNIVNQSSSSQTVKLGLSFGANRTLNGGASSLIIGGGLTNTANLTTLTLAGNGTLTNLLATLTGAETNTILLNSTNANWRLVDNASATAITDPVQLDIQAGTLNFGLGTSAPKLESTAPINSRIGVVGGAPATLNMVNGTLSIAARLNTGTAGNSIATINQSGGTITVLDILQSADGAATAASTINVSGGLLYVGEADDSPNNFFLCSRGTGTVNIATSGQIACGTLDVSRNIGTTIGNVNLNSGGTLRVSRVGTATGSANATQNGSVANFFFNGGTLLARASSTTFFQGATASPSLPITTTNKVGGAIIDTDTNVVSFLEPIQHDSALGATPDGGLIKKGSGTLTLTAASTYTGPTAVSNGTLVVNGSLGATAVTVASGGTIAGNGSCGANLAVLAGGTVSPGTSAGTLTFTTAISLSGTALMEINPAVSANDLLRSISGNISYGGTLTVTNIGGLLTNGHSFKLFNAGGGTYAGGFSTVQLPGLGVGQSWNTSQLNVSGTISVVGNPAPPAITGVASSGGNLIISGGNGVTNGTYQLLTSTNVAAPVGTWTVLGSAQFDANGNFSLMTPIQIGTPVRFFRVQMP